MHLGFYPVFELKVYTNQSFNRKICEAIPIRNLEPFAAIWKYYYWKYF